MAKLSRRILIRGPEQNRQSPPRLARRPFWLPASNYYVLATAVSIAFFFLAWGILHDANIDTPWVTAGIGASIILGGAVILRELILRRARNRYMRPDPRVAHLPAHSGRRGTRNKLTLEQNAALLGELKQKSNAARVLNKFAAGHREVFEFCSEYLALTESELGTMGTGSPRFGALLKGRKLAAVFHRYHLLQWAEIAARSFTSEANNEADISERIKAAKNALGVVEFALESYPSEQSLLESRDLLREMAVSIKVSDCVERAERAVFKGDLREALSLYRDALFYLGRDNVHTDGRQQAAMRINAEIDRIRLLERGE